MREFDAESKGKLLLKEETEMTKIEALELELAARKMVEGTALNWRRVIRYAEGGLFEADIFPASRDCYELALGIIEGKPVWAGDELYCGDYKFTAGTSLKAPPGLAFSWLPPTPKTVMVELSVADAEQLSISEYIGSNHYVYARLAAACRKALENLK